MVLSLIITLIFTVDYISFGLGGTLTDIITHYDTLNREDVRHRIVRKSVPFPYSHDRNIHFVSHGKTFHLKLQSSRDVFADDFQAVTVDRFGKEKPLHIDMDRFYKGYVEEDASSSVIAHVEEDDMITATVESATETYFIEPMWRHVDKDPSHDMIVYKASDFNWNLTNTREANGEKHIATCGFNGTVENDEEETEDDGHERYRRQTEICTKIGNENTCNLIIVGDYNFLKNIGNSHAATATNYMLQVIQRVNKIYRETCWTGVGNNIGVQVQKAKIHSEYTPKGSKDAKYNEELPGGWNVDNLLSTFSLGNWKDYCLAHLFTYQDFQHGVIGLAFITSPHTQIGGICSPRSRYRHGLRSLNCGLTTYINWNRRLTTLEANLVTAHEIGHNFGSNHDPKRCSNDEGGKYIMYATSVTGEKPNNRVFSQCSKEQIGRVLQVKRMRCFKDESKKRCGNSIVEGNEQCDSGVNQTDPCCVDCRLRPGAQCSDSNDLCCKNCQIAPNTHKCRDEFALDCKGEVKCDGVSKDCIAEAPKLDGGECNFGFRKGECRKGVCTSFCDLKGAESCYCASGENACKVCCKPKTGGDCRPLRYPKKFMNESDGVQCNLSAAEEGLCITGACTQLQRDVKETFKDLLTNFSLDKAVRFMENNIVLTILFFSLLIWIPASILVDQLEKKKDREEMEKAKWRKADDAFFKEKKSFKKKKNEGMDRT